MKKKNNNRSIAPATTATTTVAVTLAVVNNNKIFDAFVKEVNLHTKNNTNLNGTTISTLKAVPIISYHSIENNNGTNGSVLNGTSINGDSESGSTNVDEFAKEMKYLHDNGFTVLPLTSLKYNEDGNYFYLNYNGKNNDNKIGNSS